MALSAVLLSSAAVAQESQHFHQPGWVSSGASATSRVEVNIPRGQGGPVTGLPLSGTETYRGEQTLADGTHVHSSNTSQFYRDDQGRMRSENSVRALIFDPVARMTYELDLKTHTYSKTPLPARTTSEWISVDGTRTSTSSTSATFGSGDMGADYARRFGSSSSAKPVSEELPSQIVNGVFAKGSRITIAIPAGTFGNDREVKVVNERWYSDDLKVLLRSTNSDPRYGTTTYELTQIVTSPPNPALFQVPSDYKLKGKR